MITGQKEGEIEIDFSKMQKSDAAKKSRFEVAGRVYYEAHVFGYKVSSFTSSGFLDREGYEVLPITSSKLEQVDMNQVYMIAAATALLITIGVASRSKTKEKIE